MRILEVFNKRKDWGGEDHSIDVTADLLRRRGNVVEEWYRDVAELQGGVIGAVRGFAAGIHSTQSSSRARSIAREFKPDVVHAHNLYPLLSPSVLSEFQRQGVATVWHPHDQRPMCATGRSLYRGKVCRKCENGGDHWCVLRNCRGRLLESIAYATRNAVHRHLRVYQRSADLVVVWSEFLRGRLLRLGFGESQVRIVPHPLGMTAGSASFSKGDYVAYLGRISPEKGIGDLLSAAALTPTIPFKIAGDSAEMPGIEALAPRNVEFSGWVGRSEIDAFLEKARFIVIPSVCFETFPTVALEALSRCVPCIGTRTGGIPEVIREGETGLLVEMSKPTELARSISRLWTDIELCRRMGTAGRKLVLDQYSDDAYCESLLECFRVARAIRLCKFVAGGEIDAASG